MPPINKILLENLKSRYFSRELSWLAFNERVLDEAENPTTPLLERVKFLSIVSSNLEEFFMIRLAGLLRLQKNGPKAPGVELDKKGRILRDGIPLNRLIFRIREWVLAQKIRQAKIFEDVSRELSSNGLLMESGPSDLGREIFLKKILPAIAPQRISANGRLMPIRGSKLYMLAKHRTSHSIIEIPSSIPRLILVHTKHVFFVDRLIAAYKEEAFRSKSVTELLSFKVSRDAEIELDEDADDPLTELEEQIKGREFGPIVRVEVDTLQRMESVNWLMSQLEAPEESLYSLPLPLDLKAIHSLHSIKRFKKLRYKYPEPRRPLGLPATMSDAQFYRRLDKNDLLLHHPYVSFDPVIELVKHASTDPSVTRICQTLYRTSGKSPILEALMQAAAAGKKVTALVEIKARFDEANNIRWARALERAGARVIYGTPNIKIHAKLTYVERVVGKNTKHYVHVSTGNYHPKTARYYTDLGLITTQASFAAEARRLFDVMESMDSMEDPPEEDFAISGFKRWAVAPHNLHEEIIKWIHKERIHAEAGKPSGIRAKMNGLVENRVIDALYEASQAGVKIDLFIRGMCCLRPGVKGLSENIRVRSIVDKYLEHSRVFIFENGGHRQVWLSSADWMPRNFFRRIELAVPVENPQIIQYISEEIWSRYDRENVRAQECDPVGVYQRLYEPGTESFRSQFAFETLEIPEFPNGSP